MVQERRHPSMTLSGGSHRGSNASLAVRLVGGVSASNANPAAPVTHGLSEEIAWRRWHRGSPLAIPKGLVAQKKGLVNRPRTCPAAAQGCYTVVTAIGQELRSPASVYGHRPRASQSRCFFRSASVYMLKLLFGTLFGQAALGQARTRHPPHRLCWSTTTSGMPT